MAFADNLKRICRERGTNPTRLCKELGFSTAKVTAWNRGSLPKQEVMQRLAHKLGCSVADFFTEKPISEEAREMPEAKLKFSIKAHCGTPLNEILSMISTIEKVHPNAEIDVEVEV